MIVNGRQTQEMLQDSDLDAACKDLPNGYIIKERKREIGRFKKARYVYEYCLLKRDGNFYHVVSFMDADRQKRPNFTDNIWVSAQVIGAFIDGYRQRIPELNELKESEDKAWNRLSIAQQKIEFLMSREQSKELNDLQNKIADLKTEQEKEASHGKEN